MRNLLGAPDSPKVMHLPGARPTQALRAEAHAAESFYFLLDTRHRSVGRILRHRLYRDCHVLAGNLREDVIGHSRRSPRFGPLEPSPFNVFRIRKRDVHAFETLSHYRPCEGFPKREVVGSRFLVSIAVVDLHDLSGQ